jgi:2-amino-4-hydroxy-6-hydroxymethyldihydropteridine diphosphokinase
MTQSVYLSLGSNLGDRERNLWTAVDALSCVLQITAVSSVYETEPVGVVDQPAFLNLAIAGTTKLAPTPLLVALKTIEQEVGREPGIRWGPRVVDIDILLYGDLTLDSPGLVIPHPEMTGRAFVLIPLDEIAGTVLHPGLGRPIRDLRNEAPGTETVRLFRPA